MSAREFAEVLHVEHRNIHSDLLFLEPMRLLELQIDRDELKPIGEALVGAVFGELTRVVRLCPLTEASLEDSESPFNPLASF
jgi:hypothetical protein